MTCFVARLYFGQESFRQISLHCVTSIAAEDDRLVTNYRFYRGT